MRLRAALGAVVLLGLLVASGCGPKKFADEPAPLDVRNGPPSSESAPPPSSAGTIPIAVRIPSIGVDNRELMQVGLVGKELEVPPLSQPKLVGWFKLSPIPGDSALCSFAEGCVQSSVLVSHVNADGVQGGFANLAKCKVKLDANGICSSYVAMGGTVEVDRSDGKTAVFKVTKMRTFLKTNFDSKMVYGSSGPSLVAVTCGPGAVVKGSYLNQTVLWADLVTVKPTEP